MAPPGKYMFGQWDSSPNPWSTFFSKTRSRKTAKYSEKETNLQELVEYGGTVLLMGYESWWALRIGRRMIVDVFNGKEPMNRAFALRMHSHFVRKRTTVISLTVVYVLNWNCGNEWISRRHELKSLSAVELQYAKLITLSPHLHLSSRFCSFHGTSHQRTETHDHT